MVPTHTHKHTPLQCFQWKCSQYVCTCSSMMYFKADVMGMDSNWLRVPIGYGWVKVTSVVALSEQSYIFLPLAVPFIHYKILTEESDTGCWFESHLAGKCRHKTYKCVTQYSIVSLVHYVKLSAGGIITEKCSNCMSYLDLVLKFNNRKNPLFLSQKHLINSCLCPILSHTLYLTLEILTRIGNTIL